MRTRPTKSDRYHSTILASTMLLGGAFASPVLSETDPSAQLYVKTSPSGAQVQIDGKTVGDSDGLYPVTEGHHVVNVKLPGHQIIEKQVDVPASEIVRLELILDPVQVSPDDTGPDADASDPVIAYVRQSTLEASVKDAMLAVVRQHPNQNRWSGKTADTLFGIAVKRLSADPRHAAIPALVELTQVLALDQMLTAKSLLDLYQAADLTDATTLVQAVAKASQNLDVSGVTVGATQHAGTSDGFAVAYIVATDSLLRAHLAKPPQLQAVRLAYGDVMYAQVKELMAARNWKDAILLLRHLHRRQFASQSTYLDAATCFKELGQADDAVRVLNDAILKYGDDCTEEFLENTGNLAMGIDTPAGQNLAVNAYKLASARLRETITGQNGRTIVQKTPSDVSPSMEPRNNQ